MSKGIVLLALGHHNYGRMALNLALSIRYHDKRVPIHLVHTAGAVASISEHMRYFTSTSICPDQYYNYQGNPEAYIKAKVHLYDLSPYDQTLFLDVDTIWLPNDKKPSTVMEELNGKFAIANRGFFDFETSPPDPGYSQWVAMEEVRACYELKAGKYYSLHSEFIYFEKNEANAKYFETVKQVYEHPKVLPTTFAGAIPDELAFSIASILCNHYPHQTPYTPTYWAPREKENIGYNIHERFYLLSIGGKVLTDGTIKQYDRLAHAYASKESIQYPFLSAKNAKQYWLPERKSI